MKSIVAFLFGLLSGALIILLGWFVFHIESKPLLTGIGNGFGAGVGVIVALLLINGLVGYLDRLSSGKA